MGLFFYNRIIWVYFILIKLFSIFDQKALNWLAVRSNSIWVSPKLPGQKRVWLHASSIGEYEQGIPLLRFIKDSNKAISIVVSFYSPSTEKLIVDQALIDQTLYMPIDMKSRVQQFVESIDPDVAIFVKYDFWINHLKICFEKSIPVFFISVRFRKNQFYFGIAKKFYAKYFKQVTHFFVQDQQSSDLLIDIGCSSISICGDTRVDRVLKIFEQKHRIAAVEDFLGKEDCIVIGSCWAGDLSRILPFMKENLNRWKWIIVPHHPDDQSIMDQIATLGSHISYDQLEMNTSGILNKRILIVNRMGLLSNLYHYATVAFVGGAFKGTLHNILEPAVFGVPVIFGKHIKNKKFGEATALIGMGGAFQYTNTNDLTNIFQNGLNLPSNFHKASAAAFAYVRSSKGATEQIFHKIYPYFNR